MEKKHLKVLHLVKTSVGATWAMRQMRELIRLGFEVHVAMPINGTLVSYYQQLGVQVHPMQLDFPIKSLWYFPDRCKNLRHLIAEVKPDIIHSHFLGTTLTMRIALGKFFPVPRVFQVPGPLHLEHAFSRNLDILTAGNADYWIGSCEWTSKKYISSGIPPEHVFLSYYGTDIDKFSTQKTGKLRQELGLSSKVKIIGMVAFMYAPKWYLGQQQGLKGHEDLIDALAFCLKKREDIVGVFIGGAWNDQEWYEHKIRLYGEKKCGKHAIFLGTRNDVADLYSDIDIAVHPSHSENVGGAVESLLSCIPTITTNIGGFPDLVRHGKTGWLVSPKCPEELADTILEVLSDYHNAQQIAESGQKLAQEMFNVRTSAAQIADIYTSILTQT